jgi:hypothetical protein
LTFFLPALDPAIHDASSQSWTFKHTSESTHRLDWVCVPISWKGQFKAAHTVRTDIDVALVRIDHHPAEYIANIIARGGPVLHKSSQPLCNRNRLDDPDVISHIEIMITQMPPIPWEVETSTHMSILQRWIALALRAAAPPEIGKRRQEWMTKSTWDVIVVKGLAIRFRCRVGSELKKLCQQNIDYDAEIADRTALLRMQHHSLKEWCRELAKSVRAKVKEDQTACVAKILELVSIDMSAGRARHAFKALQSIRPYVPRPIVIMQDDDGEVIDCPQQVRELWMSHWQELYKAERLSVPELVV